VTWTGINDKLGAEVMKSRGLEKELDEVKASLLMESDGHNTLRVAIQLVFDNLELALEQETSSIMVRTVQIMDRECEITRDTLCFDVHRLFAIARSHYENIHLATMSQGFAPSYSEAKMEDIEKEVAPLAHDLSSKIEDEIIPPKN